MTSILNQTQNIRRYFWWNCDTKSYKIVLSSKNKTWTDFHHCHFTRCYVLRRHPATCDWNSLSPSVINTLRQEGHCRSSEGNRNPPITSATGWLGEEGGEWGRQEVGEDEWRSGEEILPLEASLLSISVDFDAKFGSVVWDGDCAFVSGGRSGEWKGEGRMQPLLSPLCWYASPFCSGSTGRVSVESPPQLPATPPLLGPEAFTSVFKTWEEQNYSWLVIIDHVCKVISSTLKECVHYQGILTMLLHRYYRYCRISLLNLYNYV